MNLYKTLKEKKKVFHDYRVIDTEKELDKYFFSGSYGTYIYRGVSEAKYKLYNSAQRFWIGNKIKGRYKDYYDFVDSLCSTNKVKGGVLDKLIQQFSIEFRDFAVLCYLQHYGCPTPLLDFTYNIEVALFFSTYSNSIPIQPTEIDKYSSIYIIKKSFLDLESEFMLQQLSLLEQVPIESLDEKQKQKLSGYKQDLFSFRGRSRNHNIYAVEDIQFNNKSLFGLKNNLNILNQEGLFVLNSHPKLPLEDAIIFRLKKLTQKKYDFSNIINCYEINKELKPYLKSKIKITYDFLFPNPTEIANDVLSQGINKLNKNWP
jgi:FRG domain